MTTKEVNHSLLLLRLIFRNWIPMYGLKKISYKDRPLCSLI